MAPGTWNLLASKDGQFGDVLLKRLPGLLREQKRLREEQGVKVSIEELLRGELDERKREQYKARPGRGARKEAGQATGDGGRDKIKLESGSNHRRGRRRRVLSCESAQPFGGWSRVGTAEYASTGICTLGGTVMFIL